MRGNLRISLSFRSLKDLLLLINIFNLPSIYFFHF